MFPAFIGSISLGWMVYWLDLEMDPLNLTPSQGSDIRSFVPDSFILGGFVSLNICLASLFGSSIIAR